MQAIFRLLLLLPFTLLSGCASTQRCADDFGKGVSTGSAGKRVLTAILAPIAAPVCILNGLGFEERQAKREAEEYELQSRQQNLYMRFNQAPVNDASDSNGRPYLDCNWEKWEGSPVGGKYKDFWIGPEIARCEGGAPNTIYKGDEEQNARILFIRQIRNSFCDKILINNQLSGKKRSYLKVFSGNGARYEHAIFFNSKLTELKVTVNGSTGKAIGEGTHLTIEGEEYVASGSGYCSVKKSFD